MDTALFDTTPFDVFNSITGVLLFSAALESYLSGKLHIPIWCVVLPQQATDYPQITYRLDKRNSKYTLSGTTKLVQAWYDLEVIGTDKRAVLLTGERLRNLLQGFNGYMSGMKTTCRLESRDYQYTPTAWGSDQGTHTVKHTYVFCYERS